MASGRDLRHMMLDAYAIEIDEAHRIATADDPTEQVVLVLDLIDPKAASIAKACGVADLEIEKQLSACVGSGQSAIIITTGRLVAVVDVIGAGYPGIANALAAGRPPGSYAVVGASDGAATVRNVYPMKPKDAE